MKIGVLGGGQLAKMLALAGSPLGIELVCITPVKKCSAKQVARVICADFKEVDKINRYFHDVICVTYETENLSIELVRLIANHHAFVPDVHALTITQDRWYEKKFLSELNIPTVAHYKVDCWEDLNTAIKVLQFPLILKIRRSGYDGKGQFVINNLKEAQDVWQQMQSLLLIVEAFVSYAFEVSLVFVRGSTGALAFYPLTLNYHLKGILRSSEAPYLNDNLQRQAEIYAVKIAEQLNYTGVMTIEFFCVNNTLVVNEIAPRVHNSGHWTIEGAVTSQFENHLRAIAGLPLGSTEAIGFSTMINCIGREPQLGPLLSIPGLHYHSYGKSSKINRKLGHLTLCAKDQTLLAERVTICQRLILERGVLN